MSGCPCGWPSLKPSTTALDCRRRMWWRGARGRRRRSARRPTRYGDRRDLLRGRGRVAGPQVEAGCWCFLSHCDAGGRRRHRRCHRQVPPLADVLGIRQEEEEEARERAEVEELEKTAKRLVVEEFRGGDRSQLSDLERLACAIVAHSAALNQEEGEEDKEEEKRRGGDRRGGLCSAPCVRQLLVRCWFA